MNEFAPNEKVFWIDANHQLRVGEFIRLEDTMREPRAVIKTQNGFCLPELSRIAHITLEY